MPFSTKAVRRWIDPIWIAYFAAVAIMTLVALWCTAIGAFAHSWYDPYCCNTIDCAPIPSTAVKPSDEGWVVTLNPGDHMSVHKTTTYVVPYSKVRASADDQFHACILPGLPHIMRCLYQPPMGF